MEIQQKILASFTDVIFTVRHLSKYAQKNITSWPHLKSANQYLASNFWPILAHFVTCLSPKSRRTPGRACWQATFRSQIGSKTKTPRLVPSKVAEVKTLMSYTFSVQNLRFFKENFSETIWYIGLKFSEINEIFVLLQYSEIFFS